MSISFYWYSINNRKMLSRYSSFSNHYCSNFIHSLVHPHFYLLRPPVLSSYYFSYWFCFITSIIIYCNGNMLFFLNNNHGCAIFLSVTFLVNMFIYLYKNTIDRFINWSYNLVFLKFLSKCCVHFHFIRNI